MAEMEEVKIPKTLEIMEGIERALASEGDIGLGMHMYCELQDTNEVLVVKGVKNDEFGGVVLQLTKL